MIKKTGDKKVEDFTHSNSGLETAIYLRGTDFVATMLQKEFQAPNIAILRSQMSDYCEHWITMEWHPLIEIQIESGGRGYRDDGETASIEFGCKRFWVSKSPAGAFFKCDWDVDEKHRKAKMESYGVSRSYSRRYNNERDRDLLAITGIPLGAPMATEEGGHYLLDHTPELWKRFTGLMAGIEAMSATIKSLVSTKVGIDRLLTGGGEALLLKQGKRR